MSNTSRISIERLDEVLVSDFELGKLYWKPRANTSWNTKYAGKECFNIEVSGYLYGTVDKVRLSKHRVLYALHHRVWPDQIDHIDRDKKNNCVFNLRSVNKVTNSRNYGPISTNTSGVTGVYYHKRDKIWRAYIGDRGSVYLGTFQSKDDAVKARKDAEVRLGYNRD